MLPWDRRTLHPRQQDIGFYALKNPSGFFDQDDEMGRTFAYWAIVCLRSI
jgi:hypothetical protein